MTQCGCTCTVVYCMLCILDEFVVVCRIHRVLSIALMGRGMGRGISRVRQARATSVHWCTWKVWHNNINTYNYYCMQNESACKMRNNLRRMPYMYMCMYMYMHMCVYMYIEYINTYYGHVLHICMYVACPNHVTVCLLCAHVTCSTFCVHVLYLL